MKQRKKAVADSTRQAQTVPSAARPRKKTPHDLYALSILVLAVILLHLPILSDYQLYDGGDSHEAIVKTKQITEYHERTGDIPRWNPYPEAGIPNVFFLPKPVFTPGYLLDLLGGPLGISVLYLLIGAIGMYFLLKWLRFNVVIAVVAALLFVMMPYYKSLIIVGQFLPTKFQAVMLIPWVVLAFLATIGKPRLLYAALFSLALSIQFWTQHYQVIYYTGILLLAMGIYPLFRSARENGWKPVFTTIAYLLCAFLFSILLTAYPLFVSKKYNESSIRASWGMDLSKPPDQHKPKSGVDIAFINQWSPRPSELLDLLIPAASGGSSREEYRGTAVPEWKNVEIPGYWGRMTFSYSYMYAGLVLLLAMTGLFFCRNHLVISLGITGLLFTLWSLGVSMKDFYLFFYDYLPYFRNFRTPPTSMTVVYFIIVLLAAYGMRYIFSEQPPGKVVRNRILAALGVFLLLGLVFYLAGNSFSFRKPGETYDANYMTVLSGARKELYFRDLNRYFLLLLALGAIVAGWLFGFIRRYLAMILAGVLLVADIAGIHYRYTNELLPAEEVDARYLPSPQLAAFFEGDRELYRVFPVSPRGQDLSALVPVIGDQDLQVLTTVYEINTNNLYRNIDNSTNINWNVLRIFGVKYFLSNQQVYHPLLTHELTDQQSGEILYRFHGFPGFGHFVKNYTVVPAAYDRLRMINNVAFDPGKTVILEKELQLSVSGPDSSYSKATRLAPHEFGFELYTDRQALFVVPIPYVKDGWRFELDGNRVEDVLVANHAMQAIVVPAGSHRLRAVFNEKDYESSYRISLLAHLLFYALLIFLLLKARRKSKGLAAGGGREGKGEPPVPAGGREAKSGISSS